MVLHGEMQRVLYVTALFGGIQTLRSGKILRVGDDCFIIFSGTLTPLLERWCTLPYLRGVSATEFA